MSSATASCAAVISFIALGPLWLGSAIAQTAPTPAATPAQPQPRQRRRPLRRPSPSSPLA